MVKKNRFPEDFPDEPLPHEEAIRISSSWENIETTNIVDTASLTGDQYVTEFVVSTDDGHAYRASWNGKRHEWAIGKLIRNPDSARHQE